MQTNRNEGNPSAGSTQGGREVVIKSKDNLTTVSQVADLPIKTINDFENQLYTRNIPDPEILIRTGGTKRLSNFLLWQLAYTEIFFVDKLWPDFNENDFNKIINKFYNIKRNFGKI